MVKCSCRVFALGQFVFPQSLILWTHKQVKQSSGKYGDAGSHVNSEAHKYCGKTLYFIAPRVVSLLNQVPTGEDDTVKEGFVMFLSFAFFGAMPLLG